MKRKLWTVRALVHIGVSERKIEEKTIKAKSPDRACVIAEDEWKQEKKTPLESKAYLKKT